MRNSGDVNVRTLFVVAKEGLLRHLALFSPWFSLGARLLGFCIKLVAAGFAMLLKSWCQLFRLNICTICIYHNHLKKVILRNFILVLLIH